MKRLFLAAVLLLALTACSAPEVAEKPAPAPTATPDSATTSTRELPTVTLAADGPSAEIEVKGERYTIGLAEGGGEDDLCLLRSDGTLWHTIHCPGMDFSEGIIVEDMNFDGISDFRIMKAQDWNAKGPCYFSCLWSEERRRFIRYYDLEELPEPYFDRERQQIYSLGLDYPYNERGIYAWEDGELACLRRFAGRDEQYEVDGGPYTQTRYIYEYWENGWEPVKTWVYDPPPIDSEELRPYYEKTKPPIEWPLEHTEFTVGNYTVSIKAYPLEEESELWYWEYYRLDYSVYNSGEKEPFQTFRHAGNALDVRDINVIDANFDGWPDFYSVTTRGNANYFCNFFLWDEEEKQFVENTDLGEISMPSFDAETGIVSGYWRSSAASNYSAWYRWEDGELVLIRSMDMGYPAGEPGSENWMQTLTVMDRIGGELVEVFHADVPMDMGSDRYASPEGYEGPGYKEFFVWDDLNYHG